MWSHVLDPSEGWIKGLEKRPSRFCYHKVDFALTSICVMALRRGLLVHFVTRLTLWLSGTMFVCLYNLEEGSNGVVHVCTVCACKGMMVWNRSSLTYPEMSSAQPVFAGITRIELGGEGHTTQHRPVHHPLKTCYDTVEYE